MLLYTLELLFFLILSWASTSDGTEQREEQQRVGPEVANRQARDWDPEPEEESLQRAGAPEEDLREDAGR